MKSIQLKWILAILLSAILVVAQAKGNKSPVHSQQSADNFLTRFFDWVADLARPVHGEFKIDGFSDGEPPLALINKQSLLGVSNEIEQIVYLIQHDAKLRAEVYRLVYNDAKSTTDCDCDNEDQVCGNAARAKNAAFVYLLGIDDNGNVLDGTTSPTRDFFRQRAI